MADFTALSIILEGDNCWPDLKTKTVVEGDFSGVAVLPAGMQSGKPSVALRIDMPDGTVTYAQTSLALFLAAADAFRARYGDPRNGFVPTSGKAS